MLPIGQLLDQARNSLSSLQSNLVGLSSFPSVAEQAQSNNDFVVYSQINVISQGYTPEGNDQGPGPSYVLPPPLQVLDMDSADWQATEFYVLKEAMKQAFQSSREGMQGSQRQANMTRAIGGFVSGAAKQLGAAGKEIANQLLTLDFSNASADTIDLMLAASATAGGGQIYSAASIIKQATFNPNVELLYRSPKLRQMQFQWKLVPLSEKDSEQIFEFVRKMKSMMYPESSQTSGWLGYPARFTIRIKTSSASFGGGPWSEAVLYSMGHTDGSGTIRGGENIGCVLTDLQVEYGEGGQYGPHKDHAPSTIMINMSFMETTLQTRNSIEKEFQ
jgi:hypothetical protein